MYCLLHLPVVYLWSYRRRRNIKLMGHISVGYDGVHGIIFISKANGHLFVRSLSGKHIIETNPFFEKEGIMGMNTFNTSVPQTHPDMQVDHAMSYNNMYYLIAAAEAMGDEGLTGNNIPTAMPYSCLLL